MKTKLLGLMLFFSSYNLIAQIPGEIPSSGLVAAFLFNGNPNNSFGFATPPLITGNVTLTEDRYGTSNNAYHFGGNGYIDMGVISGINSLGTDGPCSFSFWVLMESIGNNGYILETKNDNSFNPFIYFYQAAEQLYSMLFNGSSGGYEHSNNWTTSSLENEWFHVVNSYDGSVMRYYLNGIEVAGPIWVGSESLPTISSAISARTIIGGSESSNDHYSFFDGKIDDILIYNRVLTDLEILSIYNGSASVIKNSENDFTIYPNPTIDFLNVDDVNVESVKVFDMNGRMVLSETSNKVDISALHSGVYTLLLNGVQRQRFLKN